MTPQQKAMARAIQTMARDAERDLGQNAQDDAKARPTVAQLNRTLVALEKIRLEASHLLASTLQNAAQ